MDENPLIPLVAEELAEPVEPRVASMAAAIARRHGAASRAVLFYGSCLRADQLDGLMLDFYLVVSDYPSAYGGRWLAAANRLIPPNVFPFEQDGLVAKYAVLSEADFARLASADTRNVSVWARFAQPSRLAWAANELARRRRRPCFARRVRCSRKAFPRSTCGAGLSPQPMVRSFAPSGRGARHRWLMPIRIATAASPRPR
jgi:hypothetical protein